MVARTLCILALGSSFLVACADADRITPPTGAPVEHRVTFVGSVFDGATGQRLDGYQIQHVASADPVDGTVDDQGRFTIPNRSVWDDYTIRIDAESYRLFRSHNASVGLPPELSQSDDIADIPTHQTLHFDAYVFPSDLQAPAVTFTVTTELDAMPSGTMRLRPVSSSVLVDSPNETPSGVPGQLWTNDEDLQAATTVRDFENGSLSLEAGDLVYGVTYQVDIYDVSGFQPLQGLYTAGVETDKTFVLEAALAEPLEVLASDHPSCEPPSSPNTTSGATVIIELNHQIEPHDENYPGGASEAIDDGLSITSPDSDSDMTQNALKPDASDSAQERGVGLNFNGQTLTISWDPSTGLDTTDPDDPIEQVTYGGLSNVEIRRVGAPSSAASLSTLLNTTSIVCQ